LVNGDFFYDRLPASDFSFDFNFIVIFGRQSLVLSGGTASGMGLDTPHPSLIQNL